MSNLKKQIKFSDTFKGYLKKDPYSVLGTYSIFSFRCPMFVFEIVLRFDFGTKSFSPLCLPTRNEVYHALADFFESGDPQLINSLDCVRFWFKGDCKKDTPAETYFVNINGSYKPFLDKCYKLYCNFVLNYNPKNFYIL